MCGRRGSRRRSPRDFARVRVAPSRVARGRAPVPRTPRRRRAPADPPAPGGSRGRRRAPSAPGPPDCWARRANRGTGCRRPRALPRSSRPRRPARRADGGGRRSRRRRTAPVGGAGPAGRRRDRTAGPGSGSGVPPHRRSCRSRPLRGVPLGPPPQAPWRRLRGTERPRRRRPGLRRRRRVRGRGRRSSPPGKRHGGRGRASYGDRPGGSAAQWRPWYLLNCGAPGPERPLRGQTKDPLLLGSGPGAQREQRLPYPVAPRERTRFFAVMRRTGAADASIINV